VLEFKPKLPKKESQKEILAYSIGKDAFHFENLYLFVVGVVQKFKYILLQFLVLQKTFTFIVKNITELTKLVIIS
jgi:hypothetical protein